MENFLQQLFSLFVAPPGSLVYYLVLAFSIIAALQVGLIGRQGTYSHTTRRLLTGLILLLVGQIVLFIASGLAWQGFINPHTVLPPLDRAVTIFCLLWIAWLWVFPLPNRLADGVVVLLSLVIAIVFGFSLNNWALYPPDLYFNGTVFDQGWEAASLAIVLIGMFLLFVRRPEGWGIGLSMLTFNLAGHLVQFIWPAAGSDFAGVVRLAVICSFPLLPVLAQRSLLASALAYTPQVKVAPVIPSKTPAAGVERERRRYSADPRAVFDWLQLAVYSQPDRLYAEFTRAFAQTMMADLCLLVRVPDANGTIVVLSGYDLIHEEYRPSAVLGRDAIPAIANALQKGRALVLGKEESASPDLSALAQTFGLSDPGTMMLVPLAASLQIWGGIILLSPYSSRTWTGDDQTYLLSSTETMLQVLLRAEKPVSLSLPIPSIQVPADSIRIKNELEQAQHQLEEMKGENRLLLEEIAVLRGNNPDTDLESLLAVQKESQEIIASLQEENERLQAVAAKSGLGESSDLYLEDQLHQALAQTAHLENALAESKSQILNLQQSLQRPAQKPPQVDEDGEVINALVQEYRQPMASIMGYTDLLLAESAGIIGALQRNFLERIKGSIERLQAISNDLIQITHLQSGPLEFTPEPINAGTLIDEAMAAISSQVRAKNISLRVDLPDELPEIRADRDALQQIVVHLLQNASSATPVEGTISLRVHLQTGDHAEPAMLLQVTDTGGGIASEDLPRVFSRRYRADNALIQGVGDTGVGLSIAKTLVEAQNGRIWVESTSGQSSTFSVLLPLSPKGGTAATMS